MAIPAKLNGWQWAFVLLSVLWLTRVVVLALDDYPSVEASANQTFDDVRYGDFVLHEVPAASTDADITAMYGRVRRDLDSDSAAGRQIASLMTLGETMVVDLTVHAANHSWLESELADISRRAWRGAYVDFYSTWLAVWVVPVLVLALVGWAVSRFRRGLRRT